jgi:hypothetical protein
MSLLPMLHAIIGICYAATFGPCSNRPSLINGE